MSQQPEWECIAQLGDANPTEYGGYWIFRDKTGVYPEEGEFLVVDDENEVIGTVYRFILERCTFINGVLSDNSFHPEHPAWFADSIKQIAECVGMEVETLIEWLCSENALERAAGYEQIGHYHGFINLDQYPLDLKGDGRTSDNPDELDETPNEIETRYSDPRYQTPDERS